MVPGSSRTITYRCLSMAGKRAGGAGSRAGGLQIPLSLLPHAVGALPVGNSVREPLEADGSPSLESFRFSFSCARGQGAHSDHGLHCRAHSGHIPGRLQRDQGVPRLLRKVPVIRDFRLQCWSDTVPEYPCVYAGCNGEHKLTIRPISCGQWPANRPKSNKRYASRAR
jgi:hypothetical protein